MMPRVDDLEIPGVRLVHLEPHVDERGSVFEVVRREWFPRVPDLIQANLSRSKAGVLRGLHYHRRQADLWIPVDGQATAALVDLRPGSPAQGRPLMLDLDAARPQALYVPPGVAHGFCARTDYAMLYFVDRYYDGGADEHGVSPLDPALAIAWPTAEPTLSERDRTAPSMAEALATTPFDPWAG
jgi:dTDP-4-dehydrorhamnose 3,5-epimerase